MAKLMKDYNDQAYSAATAAALGYVDTWGVAVHVLDVSEDNAHYENAVGQAQAVRLLRWSLQWAQRWLPISVDCVLSAAGGNHKPGAY